MIGFTAPFAKILSLIFSLPMHPCFKELFSKILRSTTWKDNDLEFVLYHTDGLSKKEFEDVLVENGFAFEIVYEDEYSFTYNISWNE